MDTETPKRRGRPPKVQDAVAFLQKSGGESQRRATENGVYCAMAAKWLGGADHDNLLPPYDWLNGRITILAELGRLSETTDIKPFAARICELKPSAVEGAAILRRVRRGGMAPGSVDGLFDVLLKAFDQYVSTHAPMTPEDKLLATQQLSAAGALLR